MIGSLGATPEEREQLQQRVDAFADRSQSTFAHPRTMEVAELVREISGYGEQELDVCKGILESVASYLRSRRDTTLDYLTLR